MYLVRTNQIKANWRLEDLGWTLYPPGDPEQWDGLLSWFRRVIGKYQPLVEQHSLAAALGAGVVS